jgi:phage shock protein C
MFLIGVFLFLAPALSAIAIRRSLSIAWHIIFLVLCLLYAVSPLLLGVLGLHLSKQFNCEVNIAIYTCADAPQFEDLITGLTFAPWGMVLTIISSAVGIVGLLISLIVTQRASQNQLVRPPVCFYRNYRRKAIAGICSAIAQNRNLSLLGVRSVVVVLTILAPTLVPVIYAWMWLAFPAKVAAS